MASSVTGEFLNKLKEEFSLGEKDIKTFSPLVLAYIGDCIYEIVIRTILVELRDGNVQKLHKETTWFVKAGTQADIMELIKDELTEEELSVYRRGRNAKSHTAPKNADIGQYHKATGFESLIGYLYLTNENDRLIYLIKKGIIDKLERE